MALKFADHARFTRPIFSRLDGRISSDTLIEILLGAVILYSILDQEETRSKIASRISTLYPRFLFAGRSVMQPLMVAIWHKPQRSSDGNRQEPQPLPIPVRRRTLNVVAKKARLAWLKEAGNFFYEPEGKGGLKAIVAEFRNEPADYSVITWHDVRASIAYHDERGSEVTDVGRAAWLDEIGSVIDLPSHVTRKLIVAMQAADGTWMAIDGVGGPAKVLSQDIRRVRIILHDNKQFSVSFSLAVQLTQDVLGAFVSFGRRD